MEFWGIEVKPRKSVTYDPGLDKYVHLSQASIGEVEKDKTSDVLLSVKVDDQKLVLGTLAPGKCPQVSFDLVFHKEFELSHNGKSSVYFCGFKILKQDGEGQEFSESEEDSEDDQPVPVPLNDGNVAELKPSGQKVNAAAKPESSKGKVAEQVKVVKPMEDEDDEDNDESEEDESGSDDDLLGAGDESDENEEDDDEEDEDSSEDEETPKKAEIGNKRSQESASKTPVPEKKAKLMSPPWKKSDPDGKKTAHAPTPYPKKTAARTSGEGDKSKQQTPKLAGQFSCKACNRTFNSENALQSHNKAKHSEGK